MAETDTYAVDKSGKSIIQKDPNADLDYPFEWDDWLALIADTIADAEIILQDGATITVIQTDVVDTKVVAWLHGGTPGVTERVVCRVTTSSVPPRIDDRSIYVKIKDR